MRSTKLLATLLTALALSACKKEGLEGPLAGCRTASYASFCSADAECCSFGCVYGTCMPNPNEGGVCRTSADCGAPRFCMNQRCVTITCLPGGVACNGGIPCCSGTCTAGLCAADRPPVAVAGPDLAGASVPYRVAIQLTNASYDLDNVPSSSGLTYTWSVVSAPAGASTTFEPGPGAATPRFTPTVASPGIPYVLRLTAASGAASSVDTITFYAINTPPEIDMPPDVPVSTYQSRNVPLVTAATVTDADGGPISCTWAKKGPSASTFTRVSGPVVCAGASGAAATGTSLHTLFEDEAGTWEIQLGVDDGVNPVVSTSRFISVQNDPPVAEAGPKRWGNYSLGAIPLSGAATDLNSDVTGGTVGDAAFTWTWTVTSGPVGTSQVGTIVGTTPSVAFTPDREGLYVVTLTVDDHHGGPKGGVGTDTVQVQVEPYILPLGEVADARYVTGTNKIVLVETDAGSAYQLKIVDPATLDVDFLVTLAARPTCVALDPTQTEALVGEAGGRWQRVTGIQAIPAVANTVPAGAGSAADLVDVAHAGNCAYGVTAGGAVLLLHPLASGVPYSDAVSCPTCTGTNAPAGDRAVTATANVGGTTAPWLWLRQTGSGRLGRYEIHTNCNLQTPYVWTDSAAAGKRGLWLSSDVQDLYVAWTSVYDARSATLAKRFYGLPSLLPDHLETTLAGTELVGAVAQNLTTGLSTFSRVAVDGELTAGATRAYPLLGFNGDAIPNYGRLAFVRTGGGAYYAIVRANVGTVASPTYRWGLVNLGP